MFNLSLKQTFGAVALIASLGGLGSSMAHASTPFRGLMSGIPRNTMSKADWANFDAAASKLLAQMPSTIGQSENWQGPTGANGTLTIERIYERHDMPCRGVRAQFNNKRESRALNYHLAVCRDAQGTWRLGA